MNKKWIVGVCVLLIAVLGGWEAIRMFVTTKPAFAPPPRPTPVIQPSPMTAESRPAPPLESAKKPLLAPVRTQKKTAAIKKIVPKPVVAPTSPPQVPVSAPEQPAFVPAPAPPPPLEWQGSDTSVTHVGQIVVRNDHQWIQFWSEHHPHEVAPEVDFTRDMVIGVFAGPRPAEQFSISIVSVRTLPGSWVVDYRERLPPTGTFAVNVTVYPYHLKVIPRTTLPIKFNVLSPENVSR